MQRNHLAYEWNDVALLEDQRAYTIICKTMLQIPQQDIGEIQDVVLTDWTWQSESLCSDVLQKPLIPFQGIATLQLYYLNQELQQETFFVDVPIHGAWQEPMIEQNSMRLIFYHTKIAEDHLLLETVLQISRNLPLEHTQVLLGQFQMAEQITLDAPWPACDALLATSVILEIQQWEITARQLLLNGAYHIVCIYQNAQQPGEQVFVYELRSPMEATILVPEGLQELNGIMPYYQHITAEILDETQIQITGSGVFCTLPIKQEDALPDYEETSNAQTDELDTRATTKEPSPSVVNRRGSRRETLSKYMRNLNNSVETPSSIRNFEIGTDNDWPD